MMNQKIKIARLSILSNAFLIILKVIVGLISGSVSIISEAIHSSMDLLAAVIAFFSVRMSDTPPDREHPYGHNKVENVSGVIEAILILVAAIWIIYEAVHKLMVPGEVESLGLGVGVMLISGIVNWFVSRILYKTARQYDSIALEADALHLKADVYTSLGVMAGLVLIWITDIHMLDPIVAILVAVFILKESYELLKRAYSPLLDVGFSEQEIESIQQIIRKHNINYHNLRTRKAGNRRFADFHLEFSNNPTVAEAHELCARVTKDIESAFQNIDVTIHLDTYKDE
jgi:cation diffusion facilitator family transporter